MPPLTVTEVAPALPPAVHLLKVNNTSTVIKPLWAKYASGARIAVSRGLVTALALFIVMTKSSWAGRYPVIGMGLVTAGLLLTGVAASGRLWCSLYIAGYKDKKLVDVGPYSVCRHPLYFFSLLGAVGAAAASGTITVPLLVFGLFLVGYQPVMDAEETTLSKLFGEGHDIYQQRVPRFFPKWSLLKHPESWTSHPSIFFRHATAVIWFPAAAGLVMLLSLFQHFFSLPVLNIP